jgi:hypothetical protein
MTCCNSIDRPIIVNDPVTHQKILHIQSRSGTNIEIVFNIFEYHFYYITIHTFSNFLSNHTNRFYIYNRIENFFEEPICDGFLLLKDHAYDIYEQDEIIASIEPSVSIRLH